MKHFAAFLICVALMLSAIACAENATVELQNRYAEAELLMAEGDYAGAAEKFEALGAYSDSSQMAMYCKAISAAETLGMYDIAIDAFRQLGDFRDCKQMESYYEARRCQATADEYYSSDLSVFTDDDLDLGNKLYSTAYTYDDESNVIKEIKEDKYTERDGIETIKKETIEYQYTYTPQHRIASGLTNSSEGDSYVTTYQYQFTEDGYILTKDNDESKTICTYAWKK